jgi:hypothetical protein
LYAPPTDDIVCLLVGNSSAPPPIEVEVSLDAHMMALLQGSMYVSTLNPKTTEPHPLDVLKKCPVHLARPGVQQQTLTRGLGCLAQPL